MKAKDPFRRSWLPRLRSRPGLLALLATAGCGGNGDPTDTARVAQAAWDAFYKQEKDRIPEALVENPGTPWGEYVSSRACSRCHADEFQRWHKSFHSRTLYTAVEGTLMGDFSVERIDTVAFDESTGRDIPSPYMGEAFTEVDGQGRKRFFMRLRERTRDEGWPEGRNRNTYSTGRAMIPEVGAGTVQEVVLAFGNRRHQPYVAKWNEPDQPLVHGKHFVLPFYWNDVEKRWLYDGFRPYVEACATCHTTGVKHSEESWYDGQPPFAYTDPKQSPVFNLPPAEEGWAEGAVGCETCHGPGREHVSAVERVGVERYAELRRTGAKPASIFASSEGSESIERLTKQCDSCHNFHTESSITLVPGPEGYGRDASHWPPNRRMDRYFHMYYPDGTPKTPCAIGRQFRRSKMFQEDVHCFDCHDPHGSDHFASLRRSIEDNALCVSCHKELAEGGAQSAHSKHALGSPGNRCVECHMPRHGIFSNGVQMMSDRIHSHVFSIPRGGHREGAPPTSCNICHVDKDEAWSRAEIRRLWPEAKTRKPAPGRQVLAEPR